MGLRRGPIIVQRKKHPTVLAHADVTDFDIEFRGVMHQGLAVRSGKTGGFDQILIQLLQCCAYQWPGRVLDLRISEPAASQRVEPTASCEEMISLGWLYGDARLDGDIREVAR